MADVTMVNVLRMTSPSIFRQSRLHPLNDLHRTTVQDIPDTAHHVINEWKLVTALEIEKLISSSLNKTFQLDPLDAVETMSTIDDNSVGWGLNGRPHVHSF